MKKQVLRDYYPSGALRLESELDPQGAPDGCCREYFESGQLKVEHFSKSGRFHGRSRQWNEEGRLLGEFVCEHGSGVVTSWYPNGRKQIEIEMEGGIQHGEERFYDIDGNTCHRSYYLHGRKVTKKKYLEQRANKTPEPTTMSVTSRAPSSTRRASHGRGSS